MLAVLLVWKKLKEGGATGAVVELLALDVEAVASVAALGPGDVVLTAIDTVDVVVRPSLDV